MNTPALVPTPRAASPSTPAHERIPLDGQVPGPSSLDGQGSGSCLMARMRVVVVLPSKVMWGTFGWGAVCETGCWNGQVVQHCLAGRWGTGMRALGCTHREWSQELRDVLVPGTSVPAPAAPWLSVSSEHGDRSFYRHYSTHRFIRTEASYGLISLNTDATCVL